MSLGTLEGTGLGHIPILVFTRATDSGPSPPSINGLVKPCHTREQRFPPFHPPVSEPNYGTGCHVKSCDEGLCDNFAVAV